jgi:hypothetical protein
VQLILQKFLEFLLSHFPSNDNGKRSLFYLQSSPSNGGSASTLFSYRLNSYYAPYFVFGRSVAVSVVFFSLIVLVSLCHKFTFRYNKFARDVPQSPWSLTLTGTDESNDADIEAGDDPSRIGRNSIEEIIASYFFKETGCDACTLHGCGREDIDVRCVGNGRPFCLQILKAKHGISSCTLEKISQEINEKRPDTLNMGGDIAVSHLSLVRLCF